MKPKISIIVPIYNVENYLKRCIDSILNQTFEEFELILVNDGSSDNCGVICDEYAKKDTRIKVIHKTNGGVSEARNYGVNNAVGEYIGFIDSDDFISSHMFETLINLAEQKNADIVACKLKRVYDGDEIKDNILSKPLIKEFNNKEALLNYFQRKDENNKEFLTVLCDKIYKKNLFDEITFPIGKIYEDGYATYKLLYKANRLVHTNSIMYYYYQRENSIMSTKFSLQTLKSYNDWREIFNFIYKKIPEISCEPAKRYVEKHFQTYKKILEKEKESTKYKIYKKNIKDDLRKDLFKILKLNIGFKIKLQVILFLINYNLMNFYIYAINIPNSAKYKLKIYLNK